MTHYALTGTEYITTHEIARREDGLEPSIRSQLRALRKRARRPVDWRVPPNQRPGDIPVTVALYYREPVEAWMRQRAERRTRLGK